jgi:streptogramin lyase
VDYQQRAGTGLLWVPSEIDELIAGFDVSQLSGSSADAPATTVNGGTPWAGLAFDGQGNAWLGSENPGGLLMLTPAQLASGGAPTPTVTITSDGNSVLDVRGLAFDSNGNLWVTNNDNSRLEMFTPSQLANDGSPTPTIIIQDDGGGSLTAAMSLAFDPSGNLWVGNYGGNTVVGFSPAQLTVSSAPTPFATLSDNGGSLSAVRYITFDVAGNLWVSNSTTDTISMFTPSQQVTGAPVPSVTLTGDGTHLDGPEGMAFDNSGNMWVANFVINTVERLTPAQLAVSGSPVTGVVLSGAPSIDFSQISFYPPPEGLPIHTP